jgi:hypothetical protein
VEATWTAAAGGTKIEERDLVSVYRIGRLDGSVCGSLQRKVTATIKGSRVKL